MNLPRKHDSWEKAFNYWLDHRAESPEYEIALFGRDITIEWLADADKEIEALQARIKELEE